MTTALGQAALAQWVKATGRSWWQVGYVDGRTVNEWDTIEGSDGHLEMVKAIVRISHRSRWEELPKKGLRALRLLTPFGMGEVTSNRDYTLFQLKSGGVSVGSGGPGKRWTDAHIIGRVINSDGDCEIIAAEFATRTVTRPMRDNVRDMKYGNIGKLAFEPLGIR